MKQLAEMFDIDAPSDSYAAQAALVRERAAGAAVVASRLVSRGEGFAFEWTLYFSGREQEGESNGRSPVELAARAAEEVLAILRGGEAGATANARSDEELFYRDIARRAERAGAMQALDKAEPLMALCIDADDCSLEMYGEYLVVLAFQSDPLVLEHANKLIGRARAARSLAHEGWAYGCLMLFHLYEGEFALAEDYGNRALAMLRGAGSPAILAKVLLLRAQVAARAGEYAHATGWLDEAARLEEQLPAPLMKGWEKQQRGVVALQQGYLPVARELFAEALALVQAEQAQIHIGWTSVFSGMAAVAAGEFDMARWHFDAGLAAADQSGHPRVQIFANLHRGLHCVRTGDHEGAARSAERLATRAFATIPLGRAARRRLEGMRQLALGRADLAVAALVQAMPELADYGVWWTDACWVAAAQTALIAGETESARGVLRFLQETSNFERSNVKLATSCVLEGMLAYRDGDAAAALELFRRAKGFGVQTQLSVIIRFGLCWLEWVCTQSRLLPAAVAGTGDWLQQTAAGSMMKTQLGLPSAAARLTGSRRDANVETARFGSVQLASAPIAATGARVLPLPL